MRIGASAPSSVRPDGVEWLIAIAGLVLLFPAILVLLGLFRPVRHTARTRTSFVGVSPEDLWSAVSDLPAWPEWNPAVKSVRAASPRDGDPVYLVRGRWGELPFVLAEREFPRLVTTVGEGAGRSFSGAWSYEVRAAGDGSVLLLEEAGEVRNPLFRGTMVFTDEHAAMAGFARALGRRFGLEVRPEKDGTS